MIESLHLGPPLRSRCSPRARINSRLECGPGSISQAHQPDEYVALEQLAACERFLRALCEREVATLLPRA